MKDKAMSDISWTKTGLIEIEGISPLQMKEWELWQVDNLIYPLEGLSQTTRNRTLEALDYKGVFKFWEGDKALAALKRILKVEPEDESLSIGDMEPFGGML